MSLKQQLIEERFKVTKSVMEFGYNKKRIKVLSLLSEMKMKSSGIIYWMSREMRVQDNWSFLFAQKLALKNQIPLHVLFFLLPEFLNATPRHFKFMLQGLAEVRQECKQLNISFSLYVGEVENALPTIVAENNIGAVVCDFSPLRIFKNWIQLLTHNLPKDVVLCQVDGHNIIPCWEASNKQEYSARTFRLKATAKLSDYLTPFPPLIAHPYIGDLKLQTNETLFSQYDDAVLPAWIKPGYTNGILMLESFCNERLKKFANDRNNPTEDAQSNLSAWLHFGQISAQRCVLEVTKYKAKHPQSFASFSEEIIIRRELADNYCYYNDKYDQFEGCLNWAQTSLNAHRSDVRPYVYNLQQFEEGKTHDALWNSAQNQMVNSGKMHGFLRMYWAKKILEWTENPEQAIQIAIYLNDKYSFDGRDPNGYVGIMWSICGVHDQGWAERQVFGKIRYMNAEGCKRKFPINPYIQLWGREQDMLQLQNKRKRKQ